MDCCMRERQCLSARGGGQEWQEGMESSCIMGVES